MSHVINDNYQITRRNARGHVTGIRMKGARTKTGTADAVRDEDGLEYTLAGDPAAEICRACEYRCYKCRAAKCDKLPGKNEHAQLLVAIHLRNCPIGKHDHLRSGDTIEGDI